MSKSLFPTGPIGNLIAFQTGGGTPSRQNPAYWTGPIPWASVKDFDEDKIELLETDEQISQQGLNNSATNLIPANTPVVCTRMAVGRVAIAPMDIAINQDLKALFPSRSTDTRYLLRLADYAKAKADAVSVGSTVKGIKVADYLNIEVPLAPPEHQSKIVEILDTLDATIRETEAVVAKLKAMKRGLLHDLLTRGIDANGNLRPPQSKAPHLYKQTPLGWLPKEWEAVLLGDQLIGGPRNGYSPQDAGRETGVKMLGLGCLTEDGFEPHQLKNAPESVVLHPARLEHGDLLISRSNTMAMVGRVGRYRDVGAPCIYPDLIMRLVPCMKYQPDFLELLLQSERTRRQIQNVAVGTSGTMVKINSKTVRALLIPLIGKDEQERILDGLSSITTKLALESAELEKLRLQKSGLMDDLLTGRMSVTPQL
ncbi:restriction endonuclease subunit S [Gluconacetobacter azotocaptans]|uniref:restriction endonuclease subunit S n=1 Tax=Gluconacetobacter azotocaptans TaxID=142834 RepID=UPI0019564390|nr:restriction endonuclease subunit S [Gluconacetobacter azotocaptans]MBM9401900.1 restriction endonuclease subunit S [Gluconacetobacter azotocaptans]